MDADERVERLGRIAWAAGILMPDCKLQRTVARMAPRYGEILIAEGRREEGEAFLDLWQPLAMKCNEDAFTLVGLWAWCLGGSRSVTLPAFGVVIGVLLLRADSSLSASSGPISFTRAEALLVERLKAQVTQAARDPADGT